MAKKPLRALILEDSEEDALLVVRELAQQGFDVEWDRAWTAAAMKSSLEAKSWDVALSDYSMPGFGAPAALRALQETRLDIPFIVISGTIGEDAAVDAMKNGVHDYLMKGNLKRLGAAIEREIHDAGIRRDHRRAIDKIQHLNRVLRAIRDVTQVIVTEKTPDRLLERVCECLTDSSGYSAAWIATRESDQKLNMCASRGYSQDWIGIAERLQAGDLPACAAAALAQPGVVVIEDRQRECGDCSILRCLGEHRTLAMRLAHEDRVYGVVAANLVSSVVVDDEEISLFEEMAGDVGFALHSIGTTQVLAAQTALKQAVFQAMEDSLFVFDAKTGRAVKWNDAFRTVSGYTDAEIAALPAPQSYYDERDLERAAVATQEVLQRGKARIELDLLTKEGRRIPTEYLAAAIPAAGEDEALIVSIGRDISERKVADQALKASEAKYRELYDEAPHPYFTVSAADGTIRDCNQAAGRLVGLDVSAIKGKPLVDLYADTPLGKSAAKKVFERFTRGEPIADAELQMNRADGGVVDVSLSVYPKRGEGGEGFESRSIAIDITERKRLQAQIAQSDRLASMGMLAAGVAHEINNPLCYVLYNLESLTDDLPRLSSALRKCLDILVGRVGDGEWARLMGQDHELLNPSMLDDIRARFKDALEGTHRIKGIVRGLGVFSRVERDRVVTVALMHVIEVAINMAFNEIKYRARLVKEYGKTSTIMANDARLSQVFVNLLINAAHAIGEGDVEHNEIRVRTWQEGDEVFAEVRDTGKGIPKEHLPHLFEPFFTTKEVGVGTGLGLPISKAIVEEYAGRIEVESKVGKGTSFVVRLPVKKAEQQDEAAQSDQVRGHTDVRGRILVIDDEAGVRSAMVRMLKGHEVVEAASGDEARKILEADQAFDLVLCDMMMPAMSGVELHEWLSTTHPDLAKQVVFITGGGFTPKAREHLTKVSNTRLEKPFDVANFKKIVAELVVAYRTRGP
jgi:PAS domain S-box-containing protein